MHAVRKDSSTTTKVRAVFDASAKSSTGVSLNDTLMVGPTVNSPLMDVLLCFCTHRVALVADISRMYGAIELMKPLMICIILYGMQVQLHLCRTIA